MMQVLSILLAGFAATALSAPTSASSNTTLLSRHYDAGEASMYCSDNSKALTSAIADLCGKGSLQDLVIGKTSHPYGESDAMYDHDPHPEAVQIMGNCVTSDVLGQNSGPAEDVSDICMNIMWQMCAASLKAGKGVVLTRGKEHCQTWKIATFLDEGKGFDWNDVESVNDIIIEPYGDE